METQIGKMPELLPEDVIERAKRLNPALLCDGMKDMGVVMDGCMEAAIMPVGPTQELCMAGTAITVETDKGDNFPIHVATYSALPGYVMVIDGKGYTERPYFGDLIMGAAKAVGLEGMVVDGYCRDKAGCLALGLPVFSRGQLQRGVVKKEPGRINQPIVCGGVDVKPGDLVIGGADGVTVVPREIVYEVLERAEEKQAYERKRETAIAAYVEAAEHGKPLPQLAPQWVLDLLDSKAK